MAITTFGIGLLLLGVSGVLAAVAVWRSGVLPRWSGVLFGICFALFLPQFFTPAAVRVTHGVLLAAGCVLLAAVLWRAAGGQIRSTVTLIERTPSKAPRRGPASSPLNKTRKEIAR